MTQAGAWQRLPIHAKELFGVTLGAAELGKLETFLDLVESWSARMNLVGRTSRDDLVERHLLDSLAPVRVLGTIRTMADLGSGAGFPGIPLALVSPGTQFHLVESRRKRCSFLRHVVRTLPLANVAVVEGRAEEWRPPGGIDAVVGRAIAAPELAELARGMLTAAGRLIVMRKQGAAAELAGFCQSAAHRYRLPSGERHEVAAYQRQS